MTWVRIPCPPLPINPGKSMRDCISGVFWCLKTVKNGNHISFPCNTMQHNQNQGFLVLSGFTDNYRNIMLQHGLQHEKKAPCHMTQDLKNSRKGAPDHFYQIICGCISMTPTRIYWTVCPNHLLLRISRSRYPAEGQRATRLP